MRLRTARRRVRLLRRSQRRGAAGACGWRRRRLVAQPQNLHWMLDDERANFLGGAANGADRPDESALLTRFFLMF